MAHTSTDLLEHINCFATCTYSHKQVLDDSPGECSAASCNSCWNTADEARGHDER